MNFLMSSDDGPVGTTEGLRFAAMTLAIGAAMAFFKVTIGAMTGSHALLASALYSFNTVFSAIAVVVSLRFRDRGPSDQYPYGYGKGEYIAVGTVSLMIAIAVGLMFAFSLYDLVGGVRRAPHYLGMGVGLLSLGVATVVTYRAQHLGRALRSPVLSTLAEHFRVDAFASIAVVIGIGAAVIGFTAIDRVIALLEALYLVAIAGNLLGKAVKGLMDQAVVADEIETMEQACARVEGVTQVSYVRTRRLGAQAWVDLGVAVSPSLSLREAIAVQGRVRAAVARALGDRVITQVRAHSEGIALAPVQSGGSGHG